MPKKVDKVRNGGEWTQARYNSFVASVLRAGSRRWPPKYKATKTALAKRQVNKKTGHMAYHYKCAACTDLFVADDVQVDHIAPVVDPAVGFVDWNTFIERLYCEIAYFQVLCKPCHKLKTAEERSQRKKKT
jgi:5-methylcytosine-specific restriction endonuclease McrA|tara:strand:- start:261 stop:653 length:393 start_codon:yes stop_codon:yes gene_type:complete